MWLDLIRSVFHAHNSKTHFSPSNDSCIYQLTIQASNWRWKFPRLLLLWLVTEACQTSTSTQVVFKWLHLPLTSRQLAIIYHTVGWWVWPWIWLLCEICGGENENGTNGCHLAVFSVDVAFTHHFMATCPPLSLPPCRSANGILWLCQ